MGLSFMLNIMAKSTYKPVEDNTATIVMISLVVGIIVLCAFAYLVRKPLNEKISVLNTEIKNLKQKNHDNEELNCKYLHDISSYKETIEAYKSNLTAFPYMAKIKADCETLGFEGIIDDLKSGMITGRREFVKSEKMKILYGDTRFLMEKYIVDSYKLDYLLQIYPELEKILALAYSKDVIQKSCYEKIPPSKLMQKQLEEKYRPIIEEKLIAEDQRYIEKLREEKQKDIEKLRLETHVEIQEFLETLQSNRTAIPYMAAIMADYETYGIERLAQQLDWGSSMERAKKVKSIREIRKDAQAMVEKNMESRYQLEYLLKLFPALEDVIDCEFNQLPAIEVSELSEYDKVRDYLSKEEYNALSTVEKNQLALDRYRNSKNKTKWQIGRDYELYVGYTYTIKGYTVDYFGSYMGLEDLGRDLILKKGKQTKIVQCKYWSSTKQIHEKHITQLYGTVASYCIENDVSKTTVQGILVTNITLSDMAKQMADYLNIKYIENFELKDYPCIKCNIGHDESGGTTKIYHLPFDQQYDATKIDKPGEFFAMTVAEAENKGFRRAQKWFSSVQS